LVADLATEIKDERVLAAVSRVPRERFIPRESQRMAYEDGPLPIGQGQTISQPLIIAIMTEALQLSGGEKVLEVGTGSGYQAAILAEVSRQVITVERLPKLADSARRVLDSLGYRNIEVKINTETIGWPEEAPYDAILVTAAAPQVPASLLSQLAVGGRMVLPVGSRYLQELCKVVKHPHKNDIQDLGGCRFVPLVGPDGWEE